jgi:DNA (cytosine-5)-methyltransferase 1
VCITGDRTHALKAEGADASEDGTGRGVPIVNAVGMSVRRLTPVECERLQGFPDNYTRIPWRGKPAEECPDGGRYKALGNSMACNVMRWIGRRIELVEACAEPVSSAH